MWNVLPQVTESMMVCGTLWVSTPGIYRSLWPWIMSRPPRSNCGNNWNQKAAFISEVSGFSQHVGSVKIHTSLLISNTQLNRMLLGAVKTEVPSCVISIQAVPRWTVSSRLRPSRAVCGSYSSTGSRWISIMYSKDCWAIIMSSSLTPAISETGKLV